VSEFVDRIKDDQEAGKSTAEVRFGEESQKWRSELIGDDLSGPPEAPKHTHSTHRLRIY
jgi:hypothetical protein